MSNHSCECEHALRLLQDHFHLSSFRPGQWEILESALNGQDILGVMATGSGKSICFQLFAFIRSTLVLVVSPLIALMKDQVERLSHRGIPAACLHSMQSPEETRDTLSRIRASAPDQPMILYLSPERLASDGFDLHEQLRRPIGLIAIDEAHCVSQWGHGFRPEYALLSRLRLSPLLQSTPIMALTASATPLVLNDLTRQLQLRNPIRHIHGVYRPNLFYRVHLCSHDAEKWSRLRGLLLQHPPTGRILIYAGTRQKTEDLALKIRSLSSPSCQDATAYHAGMSSEERIRIQDDYARGTCRLLVATNAFGMGIDHPDVRLVIHYNLPANLDSLYQEMGRAGRDGQPSMCVLLYAPKDRGLQAHFIQSSKENPNQKRIQWFRLRALLDYAELSSGCRHAAMLRYYQPERTEEVETMHCGHCDLCCHPSPPSNMSMSVAQPPTAIVATLKEWRKTTARRLGQPAYRILTDKILDDIARQSPMNLAQLHTIRGIGDKKLAEHGREILSLLLAASS